MDTLTQTCDSFILVCFSFNLNLIVLIFESNLVVLRLRESGGIGEGCNDSASKYTKIKTIRFKLNEKQTIMNESHVCVKVSMETSYLSYR
jgi:hypothetical protein